MAAARQRPPSQHCEALCEWFPSWVQRACARRNPPVAEPKETAVNPPRHSPVVEHKCSPTGERSFESLVLAPEDGSIGGCLPNLL
eukprot:7633462-Pyramimonas_sp.AAC.1